MKNTRKVLFNILYISALAATIIAAIPFITGKKSIYDFFLKEEKKIYKEVKVITPKDGFLSLRSEPSVIKGFRLDKIPHMKIILIYDCLKKSKRDHSGTSGYWCKCKYNDKIGWVFDAYLNEVN